MSLLKDFRDFAVKGNVIDLAVGIIIGAAFGRIVSSVVNDIIMPPIGLLVGGIDFKDIVITLKNAEIDPVTHLVTKAAVQMRLGIFIQTLVDFIIVAFAIFMMVKGLKSLSRKKEEVAAPAPPTRDQELLGEIRDLLKK
ncbi:MAG: large-conductance mechanosensitive channel protein MscL [Syntrophothermus sp.]